MQIKQAFDVSAGWLIDGTGGKAEAGKILEVRGGSIVSIRGKTHQGNLPLIDLSNCTLLPGLIDSHVHLFMSGTHDPTIRVHQLSASFEETKPVITGHLRKNLFSGVVAVRDGGDYGGHTLRYKRDCLSREGIPCRVKAAGRAWRAPGRYGGLVGRPPLKGHTLAQSIRSDREGPDHLKLVNSGINSLSFFGKETAPQFRPDDLKEAVRAGTERGLKTMVHANGKAAVRMAVEAGAHSIEHGFFMGGQNLRRMAEKGIHWVPTAFTMEAYARMLGPDAPETAVARKYLEHQMDQIRLAMEYGVPIAAGTDAGSLGVHHGEALREEIRLLMSAGFSAERAVRCATLEGAKLLGLEHDLGSLRPGMAATFVAVEGGPQGLPGAFGLPMRIFIKGRELKFES